MVYIYIRSYIDQQVSMFYSVPSKGMVRVLKELAAYRVEERMYNILIPVHANKRNAYDTCIRNTILRPRLTVASEGKTAGAWGEIVRRCVNTETHNRGLVTIISVANGKFLEISGVLF